ncbi:adenylate kinase family protein [Candidatus Woesearchaeota archaeon]|nr:adenylate kinase family protein [Candidatus Woesearchaeota archaeon]
MKTIIVTGSVGSGKTTLSRRLAKKLKFRHVDVSRIIKEKRLSEGYDKRRKCSIVDIKKLNKALGEKIKEMEKEGEKGAIIDSHLSHYLPKRYADICICTKCSLKALEGRLKKRGYDKDKVKENVECEAFDVCLNEAKEAGHKVVVIDTTKGINMSNISKKVLWKK